ncbi:MAG TPA: hypothetical protein VGE02_15095 [Gemmatimonadales bacterium]
MPHEPVTTITDYAITLVAGWLALRLADAAGSAPAWLLVGALGAVAVAALLGGTEHGFGRRMAEWPRRLMWRLTMQLALVSCILLLAAVVVAYAPAGSRPWLLGAAVVKTLAFAHFAWWRAEYRWVVYDSLVTFAAIAAIAWWAWLTGRAPAAPWMLAGVAVSVLAGVVQRTGFAPHRHFNHNDLYHVAQIAAAYLFYRGGMVIGT